MPAFSYDFSVTANGILADMGMPTAFDVIEADFSGMFELLPEENVYIGEVLQKTRIEVDEAGTKARRRYGNRNERLRRPERGDLRENRRTRPPLHVCDYRYGE